MTDIPLELILGLPSSAPDTVIVVIEVSVSVTLAFTIMGVVIVIASMVSSCSTTL